MSEVKKGQVKLDVSYFERVLDKDSAPFEMLNMEEWIETKKIPDFLDEIWLANYGEIKNRIVRFPATMAGKNKVAIMVGASPAINKNYEALRKIDQNFIVICTPTCLKFLLERDIIPDYVIAIEGRDHWLDDFDCDTSDLHLIAGPFVPPAALDKWKGTIHWYVMGGGEKFHNEIAKDFEDLDVGGGNAINTGFLWAYKYLHCRQFIFMGVSLCYYDDYYFDGRPQPIEPLEQYGYLFQAMDIYGELVKTTPTMLQYKTWLEAALEASLGFAHGEFVNSTEDGILGVLPDLKIEDGMLRGRPKYLPWLNIIPLELAVDGYKRKLNGGNNG